MFFIHGRMAAVLAALAIAAAGVLLIGGEPFADCERVADAATAQAAAAPRTTDG
jgi:hypothetical protein